MLGFKQFARLAHLAERIVDVDEVIGAIPIPRTKKYL